MNLVENVSSLGHDNAGTPFLIPKHASHSIASDGETTGFQSMRLLPSKRTEMSQGPVFQCLSHLYRVCCRVHLKSPDA
jgi:hypothetical protein